MPTSAAARRLASLSELACLVADGAATLSAGQVCVDQGGNTITSTGGTLTLDGQTLSAQLTFDIAFAQGAKGSEVVTYGCTKAP